MDPDTEEQAKHVARVISTIISSLSSNVRNMFKDEVLVKMIVFIITEMNENDKLKQASIIDEEKFNILLNAFYKKFQGELKNKNVVLPVFLGYLLETIDKVLTKEESKGEAVK